MLSKFECEHPITQTSELVQALYGCIRAKKASSLKKGFAPEVLVLGKHTRLPGAVCSDEMLPAHLLADSHTAQGIAFRRHLEYRETARQAFVHADNDASLRGAMLRRTRPGSQQCSPGTWQMGDDMETRKRCCSRSLARTNEGCSSRECPDHMDHHVL